MEWWDDGKKDGVIDNYLEDCLNYSSKGVFYTDDENWKEKFIDYIEFTFDYRQQVITSNKM